MCPWKYEFLYHRQTSCKIWIFSHISCNICIDFWVNFHDTVSFPCFPYFFAWKLTSTITLGKGSKMPGTGQQMLKTIFFTKIALFTPKTPFCPLFHFHIPLLMVDLLPPLLAYWWHPVCLKYSINIPHMSVSAVNKKRRVDRRLKIQRPGHSS